MLWVGLELVILGFIMFLYDREAVLEAEGCYKYFFIQSLGSGLLLVGLY